MISEMALALILLTGAGLLVRTFLRLADVDMGIDPKNVVTMGLSLPDYKYHSGAQQTLFYRELLQNLGNTPGIRNAGAEGGGSNVFFQPEGQPRRHPDKNQRRLTRSSRPTFSRRLERGWWLDGSSRRGMPRARRQ